MRKRLKHLYDVGGTFGLACSGKGVSGEKLNALRTKNRGEVTCKKCLAEMRTPKVDTVALASKLGEVARKYHLTRGQWTQVHQIIWEVGNGRNVVYIAPRAAGQTTVYKAVIEIIEAFDFLDRSKLKTYDTR